MGVFSLGDLSDAPAAYRGAFLAIGNFDGVHRGHQALIGRVRARAREAGVPAVALTFDPRPVELLRPDLAAPPLTTTVRKAALLLAAGADAVGVFQTGRWLLDLPARAFFDRVVLGQFAAKGMVEGPTFGFGRDRAGDVATLATWCADAGLAFEVAAPTVIDGDLISTTRVRRALAEGRVDDAARWLGRPHRLAGTVVRGAGRGAGLGFPTANLDAGGLFAPGHGVYAAWAFLGDPDDPAAVPIEAAVHVGPNATFGATAPTVEAHLLDFAGDLYGRPLALDFVARVRGTIAFASVADLLDQIAADVARVREILGAPA